MTLLDSKRCGEVLGGSLEPLKNFGAPGDAPDKTFPSPLALSDKLWAR